MLISDMSDLRLLTSDHPASQIFIDRNQLCRQTRAVKALFGGSTAGRAESSLGSFACETCETTSWGTTASPPSA